MSELAVIAEPGQAPSPEDQAPPPDSAAAPAGPAAIALADLLVEEVSIDGMCGVY
jgi:mycofactocin precursor